MLTCLSPHTGMVAADLVQEFINILVKKVDRVPAVEKMKLNVGQVQRDGVHDEL